MRNLVVTLPIVTKSVKSKCTKKKLENQITDDKKLHQQKQQKFRVHNNNLNIDIDNIYTNTDTDNIASPNKSNLRKWSKDTV